MEGDPAAVPEEQQEEAGATSATAFAFDVPDVKAGDVLQVLAPDGVTLRIKVPQNVYPGDRMYMEKNEEEKWGIKHVVRQAAAPISLEPSGQVIRKSPDEVAADLQEANVCTVDLGTTKGTLRLRIAPSWAPRGAQRFMQLVMDGYYRDVAIYRGVPGFLVQFGIVGDAERRNKYEALQDDLLRGVPFEEGTVCFAAAGPNSRTTTLCIFLDEFSELGRSPWETPIGKVAPESLPVLRRFFTGYGDMPQCGGSGPDPLVLEEQGNDYIRANFPECDWVTSAQWVSD